MRIREGWNADGKHTVRLELRRDDPRAVMLRLLASRGAVALRDCETGFVEGRDPDEGAAAELQMRLLDLMPAQVRFGALRP